MLQSLSQRLNGRLWLPLIVSTALLGGCGGSSDSDTDNGSLYISLTDAEGDFNQYTVDVTGLKLYRANGAVIETLPNTTRLDFTQYIDVSEFLTTATVPAGVYEKAEITIDFDDAEITVEDADGNSIPGTAVDVDGNPLGSLTLTAITDDSLYEIDGVSYSGDDGLNALAGLSAGTPVVTLGRFDFDSQQYTADEIHAGSSVPWDGMDGARGSVIARDGNSLTLLGASIETGDGRIVFNDELTVLIDEDTRVYKQGSANQAGIADISIGQRITLIGQFNEDGTFDATGASNGVVRMKYRRRRCQRCRSEPVRSRYRQSAPAQHRSPRSGMDSRLPDRLRQRTAGFRGQDRHRRQQPAHQAVRFLDGRQRYRCGHDR